MLYVEFLRVRKALIWHAGILVAVAIFVMFASMNANVEVNGGVPSAPPPIPFSVIVSGAFFWGAIFASSIGTSLNREFETYVISWTKPISRQLLALQYILLDMAGVVVAFGLAGLVITLVLKHFNLELYMDERFWITLPMSLGASLMWYALVQLITAPFGPRFRSMAGILWAIAFFCLFGTNIGAGIGMLARTFDIINPLAYIDSFSMTGHDISYHAIWSMPAEWRTLFVWLWVVAFTAIVVPVWARREA